MALLNLARLRTTFKGRDSDRFERFNIVVAILLAGWVPSILMLVVSYTILTTTLESKILRDRQTFVHLIAHLIAEDFGRTGNIIDYYQTQPEVAAIFTSANPDTAAADWLNRTYYAHARIDAMFIVAADGRPLASIPPVAPDVARKFSAQSWQGGAGDSPSAYVSPVHPRLADGRMTTDIVSAVRTRDGQILGYLGAAVLVERLGKRLSTVEFADQSVCQIIDQNGAGLFGADFQPNPEGAWQDQALFQEIRAKRSGHLDRAETLYSFSPVDTTGWVAVVEQPRSIAYKPVRDLLGKIAFPAVWLILLTALGAGLAGRFTRRQAEAARRLEREVIFNEKILANMPIGIALVDPGSRSFLQANEAFAKMAKRFGGLDPAGDLQEVSYDEVKIAPADAIERVLAFGAPFQMIEHPFTDPTGRRHFVNVNLLRLQGAEQRIQGVLYLVEDKTRDVTLRQELIGANAAKDQFLALLSHELRNPLSPVIAMVSELEANAPASAEVHHALEVIRRNVELEARLIDDLLDVTRIGKGKLQLNFETVNVHEVLQRAYEICREDILAKRLQMEFQLGAASTHVSGDPARLQQVFWNLIKNSVKFTPDDGRIVVATSNPSPAQIEVSITDTGIGIEPEKIGRIFNAFEQGQSSITRRFGGLGLGLTISKAMVDAHGGALAVASDGHDHGATFTVTLQTVAAPAPGSKRADKPLDGAGGPKRRRDAPALRLLVVDDHRDTCIGMKMVLERRGYFVTVAHSAEEAVTKIGADDFDLLISDIGLPDRSGYELMEELHSSKGLRGIAVSGFGMENDVSRARAAGFAEHLTKPIDFERLEQAIHRIAEIDSVTAERT